MKTQGVRVKRRDLGRRSTESGRERRRVERKEDRQERTQGDKQMMRRLMT